MASVHIREVGKAYGTSRVIHDVSFTVEDEEFVVLVGPSGCGKSTVLRMIAGLEEISSGRIEIAGVSVNDRPARDRDIAMVFQNYALYPHKTVYENMAFSLRLQKRPKEEVDRRVREAAAILALDPLLKRQPRQLSGGQRQRVAMGRAIVRNPKVFLFDEPLSNLDAKLRVQMRAEIRALHKRLNATAVYVTHDQIEAMTMADKIVVMNAGRIEQVGAPEELYERPDNLFVAGFIGSPAMNFLQGTLAADKRGVVLQAGATLPLSARLDGEAGQKVVAGIRPENLGFGEDGSSLGATISMIEMTGPERLVSLDLRGNTLVATTGKSRPLRVGERVPLTLNPASIHVFDAASGRRISGMH
ncbi:ABC transporter ATP-binding protein [Bosea rubneri]|uniref:Sn-glycerol-3-phosphate ABC transporter ATP-binding protein UgpC n=1 Tax=Bosea rubneri TaxID=3075434 RepID=A0ABU3S1N4_9HYPH|nr:sn-glycerol-3-phosphate ABC transporter ATP-binding protein UgpC [Bosea sp. ZW T0_25]MDU0338705.1 sn-glycerol-3-phosphate ABC transporter ATP-binding protein UgpC [Bosea sp. ZW T0_25]